MTLPPAARCFRLLHTAIAVVEMLALGYVWYCAVARRRDRLLAIAIGLLAGEGGGLIIGRGNCPLGPLQAKLGDPVPLFELVLPKRAARAAVPALAGIAAAGVAAIAWQSRVAAQRFVSGPASRSRIRSR